MTFRNAEGEMFALAPLAPVVQRETRIIEGPPKSGKTYQALGTALHYARHDWRVVYVSSHDAPTRLWYRLTMLGAEGDEPISMYPAVHSGLTIAALVGLTHYLEKGGAELIVLDGADPLDADTLGAFARDTRAAVLAVKTARQGQI